MSFPFRVLAATAAGLLIGVGSGATTFDRVALEGQPSSAASDSVMIVIANSMPHPMTLAYDSVAKRVSLGVAAADGETTVVIRRLRSDSVTVWASNTNPQHNLSRRFPSRSEKKLFWTF